MKCKRLLALLATIVFTPPAAAQTPLVIGETFTIESKAVGETRRINVMLPPGYSDTTSQRLPVLYMPDGGINEDFLHIAGLLHISVMNGTMRPFILVGIENTQRRRDLTGPTDVAEDRKIARVVGGSAAFRRFIRTELMPWVNRRYRTTDETAIVGESLAGLFVAETLMVEPDLFDTYIAFDPSLWWNGGELVRRKAPLNAGPKILYLAHSSQEDIGELTKQLADVLQSVPGLTIHYQPMTEETHATIYHPAALRAFRHLFKPKE